MADLGRVEDGAEEGVPPAARIAMACVLHKLAGNPELVAETLAGLPAEEVAGVAQYAVGLAAQTASTLLGPLGPDAPEMCVRATMRAFMANEVAP